MIFVSIISFQNKKSSIYVIFMDKKGLGFFSKPWNNLSLTILFPPKNGWKQFDDTTNYRRRNSDTCGDTHNFGKCYFFFNFVPLYPCQLPNSHLVHQFVFIWSDYWHFALLSNWGLHFWTQMWFEEVFQYHFRYHLSAHCDNDGYRQVSCHPLWNTVLQLYKPETPYNRMYLFLVCQFADRLHDVFRLWW